MRYLLPRQGIRSLILSRIQPASIPTKCLHLQSPIAESHENIISKVNSRFFSLSSHALKDKNKKKGKKDGAKVVIDEAEMSELVDVGKLKSQMNQAIEELKSDFTKNLSLRSSVGSIEELPIRMDGNDYVLQDLVQIARKPKMVILDIDVFPQAVPIVYKALCDSGMNLSPQQDGSKIIINIPKVTKEHRETLSKNAKQIFEKCKLSLRHTQNQHVKKIKDKEGVSIELLRKVEGQIMAMNQKYTSEAEKMMQAKQQELLNTD